MIAMKKICQYAVLVKIWNKWDSQILMAQVQSGTSVSEKVRHCIKTLLPCHPATPLLDICKREMNTWNHINTNTDMFLPDLFEIVQNWDPSWVSATRQVAESLHHGLPLRQQAASWQSTVLPASTHSSLAAHVESLSQGLSYRLRVLICLGYLTVFCVRMDRVRLWQAKFQWLQSWFLCHESQGIFKNYVKDALWKKKYRHGSQIFSQPN